MTAHTRSADSDTEETYHAPYMMGKRKVLSSACLSQT